MEIESSGAEEEIHAVSITNPEQVHLNRPALLQANVLSISTELDSLHYATICSITSLKRLELQSCLRTPLEVHGLSNALRNHGSLEEFTVNFGRLGGPHIDILCAALTTVPRLKSVKLRLCGITSLDSIANLVRTSSTLNELDLTSNLIQDGALPALARALDGRHSLRRLILKDNEFGSNGAVELSTSLHPNLTELDLSDNCICGEGTDAIVNRITPNMTRLSLKTCWMGHIGARVIGRVLAQPSTRLTFLNLGDNAYGDSVCPALCRGIDSNSTLETLMLANNGISNNGAKVLAASLATHPSLRRMDLQRNQITMDGWKVMANAVARNTRVVQVLISNGAFYEPWSSQIKLLLGILRTEKLQTLLREEASAVWPLLLGEFNEHDWGFGLIFELLRNKPSIVL